MPRSKTIYCKLHNYAHPYVKCPCGKQYCWWAWTECPRCGDGQRKVKPGSIVSLQAAKFLPVGSRIRRTDWPAGRTVPYPALERVKAGLWIADPPGTHYGGIGSADWLVLRIGSEGGDDAE